MEHKTHISDLLKQHDCVIIPGFGGFVASPSPSFIHPLYHTFHPPYKKILFNINLKHNDGLLASHVAIAERLSFDAAKVMIEGFSERCNQHLRNNQPVLIRNLGRLFTGPEGTVQFEQDLRFNLLPESYGLQPFFALPVPRKEFLPETVHKEEPEVKIREIARRSLAVPLRWAAALAIPVGIAVLLTFTGYDQIHNRSLTYADVLSFVSSRMNPFSTADTKVIDIPGPSAKVKTSAPPPTKVIETPVSVVAETADVPPEPVQETSIIHETGRFAIIVGAFRIEENAVKLSAVLQSAGFDAGVFDTTRTGLHRVAAGTFHDRDAAVAALSRIKAEGYPGAWLLTK